MPTDMQTLAERVLTAPRPFDPERGADLITALPTELRSGSMADLVVAAAGSSPYLARLLGRHGEWLAEVSNQSPDQTLVDLCSATSADHASQTQLATALRIAKSRAALLIALADLGGVWDLQQTTAALTKLADAACLSAARWLLSIEVEKERLPDSDGYFLLAMGKMGAFELNYSSDIDLIALFDDSRFGKDDVLDVRARYVHVTRQLVKVLSENTGDGYVFRTDLRLRPNPSTTPVCMAASVAERYYESVGRTWERAAHIKARPLIDQQAGNKYLQALQPFVWRRHLDFAAIDDIHDMLRRIRDQKAQFSVGSVPGHDIKLGPGGIRTVEFSAQTRQLIMGGRNNALRQSGTLAALNALTGAGVLEDEQTDVLKTAYCTLRTIEHRLQMIDDAQTHTIPKTDEARGRLAALSGYDDLSAFDAELLNVLHSVHQATETFFSNDPAQPATVADPETAMADAGFQRPADAARHLARWREGRIPATRTERAQRLFAGIEPQILSRLARAADPDQALSHLDRFLSGLPAGIQVLSLFAANRDVLDLIVSICATAPRLAAHLGRRPQTLDALIDRDFWTPLPGAGDLTCELASQLANEDDYERVLDAARRWTRENTFRAGVQVLRGIIDGAGAGRAFTAIADAVLNALLPHVIGDFAVRHGPPPGNGIAVLAMGKLGSSEMTAGSDLDLIVIYDADPDEESKGPKPLPPSMYYPRLTQALVAALTAPTAEGVLYEIDMRLRPSGRQGPVAVSLSSFTSYQTREAWVWEHLALTRARTVTGPTALRDAIGRVIRSAIASRSGAPEVMEQASDMRRRLAEANADRRGNIWDFKQAAGGLMEIEFTLQTGALMHGVSGLRSADEIVPELITKRWITAQDADVLSQAHKLQVALQQIERVAVDVPLDPQAQGSELSEALARAGAADNLDDLSDQLKGLQSAASKICLNLVPLADRSA